VIPIAATIAAAVAVGVAAERRFGVRAQSASRVMLVAALYTLSPFVTFFNVAHLHVTLDVGGGLALAYVVLATAGVAAWFVGSRLLTLPRPETGSLMASVMQANTGYLGLPLVIALLGSSHLGTAVAYDALVTNPVLFLGVFGAGAAFGSQAGEGFRERLRAFFLRNPPLFAAVAGLVAPAALAPDALVDISRVAVLAFAPLGFFAVGVTLAAEAEEGSVPFPPPLTRPVLAAVLLRLVLAPALLLALGAALIDLPDTYLLMAAMPTGINTIVVAHVYGLDLRIAAGTIAWSTAIVVAVGVVVAVFAG
jgi:malate permease and related proteins